MSGVHFQVNFLLFCLSPLFDSKESKPILSSFFETKCSLESTLTSQPLSYNNLLELRQKPLKDEAWLVGMTAHSDNGVSTPA